METGGAHTVKLAEGYKRGIMNIKRTIVAVFILVIIGLGCIEASQAFIEDNEYTAVNIFRNLERNSYYELSGQVFRIHDDELNVTLYIYTDDRAGGITAIPDSQLEVNT